MFFLSSIKLQYSRTIVKCLRSLSPKAPKSPKAPHDFPPRKDGILYPRRVDLALPSPSQRLADGRTYGRTDVHVIITSQPKFLGLIGYQISLAMELRWRALPAGSAIMDSVLNSKIQVIITKYLLNKLKCLNY